MSGNKYPKKFQLHLTEAQHESLRQAAFTAKVSMMEYVRGKIGGLGAGGTDADAQRSGSIQRAKTVKSVSITDSESKPPAPSPYKYTVDNCPKHYFFPGTTKCSKCGWVPPIT